MKPLYVKEISQLTKVSIRTLHYYDKIGLLKPSSRLSNGYRVYLKKDLVKLEKIIALKFFGFTLARIKQLLVDEHQTLVQLENQLLLLQTEVSFLQEAQRELLTASINEYKKNAKIDWHAIVSQIVKYTTASKELKIHTDMLAQHADKNSKKKVSTSSDYQSLWKKLISEIDSSDHSNTP